MVSIAPKLPENGGPELRETLRGLGYRGRVDMYEQKVGGKPATVIAGYTDATRDEIIVALSLASVEMTGVLSTSIIFHTREIT